MRESLFATFLAFIIAGFGLLGILLGFKINEIINRRGDPVLPIALSITLFAFGLLLSWELAKWYVFKKSQG